MDDIDREIQDASATEGVIDGHRVERWLDAARSLSTLRLLYDLTRDKRADIWLRRADTGKSLACVASCVSTFECSPEHSDAPDIAAVPSQRVRGASRSAGSTERILSMPR